MISYESSLSARRAIKGLAAGMLGMGVLSFASLGAAPANETPSSETDEPEGIEGILGEVLDAAGAGRFWIKGRYRLEYVDQADLPVGKKKDDREALASTFRTVVGYETGVWNDFQGGLEFENITAIGNDIYNSTANGHTYAPIVADPEGSEINQVYLDYLGFDDSKFRLGRQMIRLDNQRFVGTVSWRQNEQTFDAFTASTTMVEDLELFYGYVDNVNTITAGDTEMETHLLNASYAAGDWGDVTGYAYLIDYEGKSAMDTTTVGARWTDGHDVSEDVKLAWALEAATQSDANDNPNSVDANYYHGELGATLPNAPASLGVKAGFEILEGDDTAKGDKFMTPLATAHAFNGWADLFLATPDTGLEDYYVGVSGNLDKAKWAVVYHTFDPQDGSMDYGDEIDAIITYPCSKRVQIGLKAAAYSADKFGTDRDKVWFWIAITP